MQKCHEKWQVSTSVDTSIVSLATSKRNYQPVNWHPLNRRKAQELFNVYYSKSVAWDSM